ncbi:DUF2291 family protein [Mesorhizobium xinjiangense]|uniref:DUF2291 family protein n=1 Tax=Mesorhizobium xinjiangense TaxID=2678685 RepID=UPI0012EE1491|nr:DUF2291 domain-containing protein [Mesorhizobium xinjiangense]
MTFRDAIPAVCIAVALTAIAGCKLVKNTPEGEGGDMVSSQSGRDMTALVDEIWDARVVPHMRDNATDLATLGPAIEADLDAAGKAHGYRPSSEGSPWNFPVVVRGVIVSAKTDTRAATADVDVDGDGQADAALQLGPVIRGTALRDVLPFIDFTSFTDQIEFAQLSRALNTRAFETALKDLPRENLVGQKLEAIGGFTMRSRGDAILITPVEITVGSQ